MNKNLYLLFIVFAQISYPMERGETCDLSEEGSGGLPRAVVLACCDDLSKSVTPETQTDRRRRTSLNKEQVNQLREGLLRICEEFLRNKSSKSKAMTVPLEKSRF